ILPNPVFQASDKNHHHSRSGALNLFFVRLTSLLGLGLTGFTGGALAQDTIPDGFPTGFDPSQPAVDAVGVGIMLVAILVSVVIGLAIVAVICYFVIQNYKAIPPEHRKMEPGKVWLMMIPLFNLYWIFPVFLGLADSFKSYFNSVGDESVGDCNRQLSLWYCISACCSIIPCLNYLAGPASLVLLIIVLVKASELKKKIGAVAY
ncbi:MAG: hypothetical protein O3C21_06715, partial [Verrucomicrobia bacterium]|nr:hypothetical protein [Verrucomicrobiota bacterium]